MKRNKETYNLDQVVSVRSYDKKEVSQIEYVPFKKSFWGNTKEGFYNTYGTHPWTKEELESGKYCDIKLLVEDKKVYYFPYVTITFVNGEKHHKTFGAIDQAELYASKIIERSIKNKLETHAEPDPFKED